MVKYRRNFLPGGTFFFTVTLSDRTSTLLVTQIPILRAAFRTARAEHPFQIDAIVILPDHLHAIFTLPPGDADFPQRWRRIKSAFTHGVRKSPIHLPRGPTGGYDLWQSRYWEHTIRNEQDFANHVAYIHNNPVKHGYVTTPTAWPHSSIHHHIRQNLSKNKMS